MESQMPEFHKATKHRYQHYMGQLQENEKRTRKTKNYVA